MPHAIGQFPTTLEDHLANLAVARAELLREVEASDARALAKSQPGKWSIPEVVFHLHLAEKSISKGLRRSLGSGQREARTSEEKLRAEWERLSSLVGSRRVPASAPASVVPANAPAVAEGVRLVKQSRVELLELLHTSNLDELASISMPHPFEFIGTLTGAGWVSLIAFHELRHTEQIREIKSSLM